MVFALAIFSLLGLGTWRGLDSLQSAWPQQPAKERGYKFLG